VSQKPSSPDPLKSLGQLFLLFLVIISIWPAGKSIYASYIAPPPLPNKEMSDALKDSPINSLTILLMVLIAISLGALISTVLGRNNRPAATLDSWKKTNPAGVGLFLIVLFLFGTQFMALPIVVTLVPGAVKGAKIGLLETGQPERLLKRSETVYLKTLVDSEKPGLEGDIALKVDSYTGAWAIIPGTGEFTVNKRTIPKAQTLRHGDEIQFGGRAWAFSQVYENPKGQLVGRALNKALVTILLLVICAFVAAGATEKRRGNWAGIGFSGKNIGPEILRGFRLYFSFLPVIALIVGGTNLLATWLDLNQVPHPIQNLLADLDGTSFALAVLVAVIGAPLNEELIFRGLLLPAMEKLVGVKGAILLSAWFFGAMHLGFHAFIPIFSLGLFLAYLTVTAPNRSIVASITAHMIHNSLSLGLFLAAHHATHS
jgi:membrane protease YdiL (CAAX protease family)